MTLPPDLVNGQTNQEDYEATQNNPTPEPNSKTIILLFLPDGTVAVITPVTIRS